MKKTNRTKVLSVVLAVAVLGGNVTWANAANVHQQNSKNVTTYQEKEPNDESTQATVVPMNQQCIGALSTTSDVDWYQVTKTEDGYMQLKFDVDIAKYHEQVRNGWCVEVYDSNFGIIAKYNGFMGIMGARDSFVGDILPYRKGVYYIKVELPNVQGAVNVPYGITMLQVKSDAWERENNDSQSMADAIKLNKQYTGFLEKNYVQDWFQFDLKKNSTVKLNFSRGKNLSIEQVEAIKSGWRIDIYRASNGTQVAQIDNVKEKASCTADLKKGKYYIKISPKEGYFTPTGVPYNFKVSYAETPAKTTIQKVQGNVKSATIKWKRVAGASGYYVYRSVSKNGTYKKVATLNGASKTTFKNKKLKSGKKYYYKVAAYKKANGVTAVADQSAAKSGNTY